MITNTDAAPAANPQKIGFRIPGAGPFTINLVSPLPAITVPVIMDATSEPGYAGMPLIEIQGKGIQPGSAPVHGLVLAAGSTMSTIKGLDVGGFTTGAGIEIESKQNTVAAMFLGTDLTGTKAGFGNEYWILINGASSNTIGGAGLQRFESDLGQYRRRHPHQGQHNLWRCWIKFERRRIVLTSVPMSPAKSPCPMAQRIPPAATAS